MNLSEALVWLDGHVNLETGVGFTPGRKRGAPTLARIRELTDLLGTPQADFPAIHVTGTNGKTSTARIAAALLDTGGASTGLTTSPHLERLNERVTWNEEPIGDDDVARILTQIAAIEEFLTESPSYFEIMIALAFTFFADVAVDIAVVEVGMGGTWDATNVINAGVAVVTNIAVDHTEFLGTTRAEIATDKAGIVHAGACLVLGETDPDLYPIFAARDPEQIVLYGRDFEILSDRLAHGGRLLDLRTMNGHYTDVFLPLHGAHQSRNALTALVAVEASRGAPLDEELVHAGFAGVRSPGRLEVVGTQPLVIIDGAHNAAGAEALRDALTEEFAVAPRTLVVGLLQEKDATEMLRALDVGEVEHLVCTRPPSPRALAPAAVAEAAIALGVDPDRIDVFDDVARAVARAQDLTPADGQIVVTGSLYVVGAARTALLANSQGESRRG